MARNIEIWPVDRLVPYDRTPPLDQQTIPL